MPNERPTSARVRHKRSVSLLLRRFLRLAVTGIHKHQARKKNQRRYQLTNAQFHLSAKETRKVIEACENLRNRLIVETLATTGMRRAEVTNLDIEDIGWVTRQITIREGKGAKQRTVPLTSSLLEKVGKLVGHRQTGPVFVSRSNGRVSARQINRVVRMAGDRAGVVNPNPKYKGITPHLFRHSFARLWKSKSGNIEALAMILGHASVKTTYDLYGKLGAKDIQSEYHRIVGKINRQTSKDGGMS